MAVLIRPKRWGRQKPPPGAQIDWSHPLANGLIFCMLPSGAGAPLDLVSGKFATPSSLTQRATAIGQGAGFNGTSSTFNFPNFPVGGLTLLSAYFWRSVDSFASATVLAELSTNYALNSGSFGLFTADGTSPTNITTSVKGTGSGTAAVTGFADPSASVLHQYVLTVNLATAANTWPQYLDGTKPANSTPYAANATITPGGVMTGGQTLYVGARGGSSLFGAGALPILAFYNRVLTQDEATRLYVEPYAFLHSQSPRQRYWITSSSTVLASVSIPTTATASASPAITVTSAPTVTLTTPGSTSAAPTPSIAPVQSTVSLTTAATATAAPTLTVTPADQVGPNTTATTTTAPAPSVTAAATVSLPSVGTTTSAPTQTLPVTVVIVLTTSATATASPVITVTGVGPTVPAVKGWSRGGIGRAARTVGSPTRVAAMRGTPVRTGSSTGGLS